MSTRHDRELERRYARSHLLYSLFNPYGWLQTTRHIAGQARATLRWDDRFPLPEDYTQNLTFRLPFDGWWCAANGGSDHATSHSWDVVNQRYAYDFLVVDDGGSTCTGRGKSLTDYYAYGRPVVAIADGVVTEVRDGVRDHPYPGTGAIDWRTRDFRGNFVMLQHSDRAFSFTAHLIPGSMPLRIGQQVSRGEHVGSCGNSGHSTEPHIHFHVQDVSNFYDGAGLPVRFSDYRVKSNGGVEARSSGFVTRGEVVAPL